LSESGGEYTVIIQLDLTSNECLYTKYSVNGAKLEEGSSKSVRRVLISKYCSVNVSPWLSNKGLALVVRCREEPKVSIEEVSEGYVIKVA